MVSPDDHVRAFLVELLRAVVGDDSVTVTVVAPVQGRDFWSYEIRAPATLRGLLLGSAGKHVAAIELLCKMRALRLGWRDKINVRVARYG